MTCTVISPEKQIATGSGADVGGDGKGAALVSKAILVGDSEGSGELLAAMGALVLGVVGCSVGEEGGDDGGIGDVGKGAELASKASVGPGVGDTGGGPVGSC